MGTRGLTGFRYQGIDKVSYQQFDSYPSGVGNQILAFLHAELKLPGAIEALRQKVAAIRLVDQDATPTQEDFKRLKEFYDGTVGGRTTATGIDMSLNWYQLLRKAQGDPAAHLRAGTMIDRVDFAKDSLFCEWGWIINLDDLTLEVYGGFRTAPHRLGRFAKAFTPNPAFIPKYSGDKEYWPIALLVAIPFNRLPTEFTGKQIAALNRGEKLKRSLDPTKYFPLTLPISDTQLARWRNARPAKPATPATPETPTATLVTVQFLVTTPDPDAATALVRRRMRGKGTHKAVQSMTITKTEPTAITKETR
jgi:hypothetical protein